MLVHNLTDAETPKLKQYGLQAMSFMVGDKLVDPGQSLEVEDGPVVRAQLEHLVAQGAAFIGDASELPKDYTANKAAKPALVQLGPPSAEAPKKKNKE